MRAERLTDRCATCATAHAPGPTCPVLPARCRRVGTLFAANECISYNLIPNSIQCGLQALSPEVYIVYLRQVNVLPLQY